jgi:AraC-like DNA-binding protein
MLTLRSFHLDPIAPANGSLKLIETVIAHMRSTPTKAINLQDAASLVDIDPYHLSHLFTKHTGLNIKHFHQLIRLKVAKRILAETTLNVTEVALECGYSSIGSFVSMFKEAVGLPPSEFRRQINSEELSVDLITSMCPPDPPEIGGDRCVVRIEAPHSLHSAVFVALCAVSDGTIRNCATVELVGDRALLPLSGRLIEPHVALAACYTANMTCRSAAIEGPTLVGRSPATASDELDVILRQRATIDPPLISALPILAIRRSAGRHSTHESLKISPFRNSEEADLSGRI